MWVYLKINNPLSYQYHVSVIPVDYALRVLFVHLKFRTVVVTDTVGSVLTQQSILPLLSHYIITVIAYWISRLTNHNFMRRETPSHHDVQHICCLLAVGCAAYKEDHTSHRLIAIYRVPSSFRRRSFIINV